MKATTYIIITAACLMVLATTAAMAVDCAAIRAACVQRCTTVTGTAQQKNCANRCSIASCQQTPLRPVLVMLTLRLFAAVHFALFRCVHCIVCRNSGHYTVSGFVHDFLLHQIQAVFGTASVRLTRHRRHNVRGRYFCFNAIKLNKARAQDA